MRTLPADQRTKIGQGVRRAAAERRERIQALEASRARVIQVLDFCGSYVEAQAADGTDPLAVYLARELEHAKEESQLAGMQGATYINQGSEISNLPDEPVETIPSGTDVATATATPSENGSGPRT